MSGTATVLEVLESAGFKRLPTPLIIAGSAFEFDAAVEGTGVSHDLVVVADASTSPVRLLRLMAGLTRVLDHLESQLPVSLILLGFAGGGSNRAELERHARVLVIEDADPNPGEVQQAIAVLLPLSIPAAANHGSDPVGDLREKLGHSATKEHLALIEAAGRGSDAVREALRKYVDAAARVDGEDTDG